MRRVLVDDDDAVSRLGDDVGLVQLRPRRAERTRRGRARLGARPPGAGAPRARRSAKLACAGSAESRRGGRGAPVPARANRQRAAVGVAAGRMARIVAVPPVVEARCSASFRRCLIAPTMRPRTGAGVAEAHFGFRRVDVDVDLRRIAVDEERRDRMPVARQEIEIGAAQRAEQRLSRTGAPVDEQELLRRVRPAIGRQARPGRRAASPRARASSGTEFAAKSSPEQPGASRSAKPASPDACGRPVEARAEVGRRSEKRTSGAAIASRLTASADGQRLRPVGFEELEPRRRGGEQVARPRPACPRRAAPGATALLRCRPRPEAEPVGAPGASRVRCRAAPPRRSRAAPRRGSRRWRCAMRSPSASFEVACRSTASARSAAVHAGAVVDDPDQPAPPASIVDLDPASRRRRARSRPAP